MSGLEGEPHFCDVRVDRLADAQVTIVGLGLMGGSLAGALREQCRRVVGVARRTETIEAALSGGLVDQATMDLEDGAVEADIVVLATPVRVILRQLATIGPLLPPGCLLMDLGSTKGDIVAAMADLPPHVQPLGGHPMCGKEKSGIKVADPALYRERTFILSPLARTSTRALALGQALVQAVGANPLFVEAQRQDYLVATVSHLPYLLACALVSTADATTSADPLVWEIVAGGYRDTSRVAGSDVTMMLDILITNRDKVMAATEVYLSQLEQLRELVASGDEDALRARLSAIRETRREMYP
ncbi:MAG TPA: prephenate dehydrogenase [Anaerolineae bacterium]|nr:prephenate dehydrogenase [Anaerolineae bacterium]